jgi:hypothetical protein
VNPNRDKADTKQKSKEKKHTQKRSLMNRTLYLYLFSLYCNVFSFDLHCACVQLKMVGENSSAAAAQQQQQRSSDCSAFRLVFSLYTSSVVAVTPSF